MKRERGRSAATGAPIVGSTEPLARVGAAVLRGIPVHHEERALPRPGAGRGPDPQRRPVRLEERRELPDALADRGAAPGAPSEPESCASSGAIAAAPVDHGGITGAPAEATGAVEEARLAGPAAATFEEGRLAGYADAEAAQRVAVEAALQRGYQAGFDQGREEGLQQGLAEEREAGRQAIEREARAAQEEAAARLVRLDALLSAIPAELAGRLESAEDDMIALCHAAVCRILGEQLVTAEGVAHAVRRAIREACGGSTLGDAGRAPLAIHVHPRDLESLRADAAVARWLDGTSGSPSGGVQWLADERVGPGGCVVSSPEGSLDARLDAQLSNLREILLDGRSAGSPAPAAPGGPVAPSPSDEAEHAR